MLAMHSSAHVAAGPSPMPTLDSLQSRIRDRLKKLGLSANEASRKAGLGMSYVNDILAGKSNRPVLTRLARLAEVLDCDIEYLTGEQDSPRGHLRLVSPSEEAAPVAMEPAMIPVYNVEQSDPEGFFRINEASRFDVPARAPRVMGAPDTYGIVVPDDSNAPRYFAGEYVYLHPNRPVSRGGFALLRMADGRATIRRVDSILTDKVIVSRLEGGEAVEFARSEIEAIHRIIGSGELIH